MPTDTPQLYLARSAWKQWLAASAAALALLTGASLLMHLRKPAPTELERQVQQLSKELQQMRQDQAMPSLVLNRYRDSICYIYGVYSVSYGRGSQRVYPGLRARVAGTGFVVAPGLVATNRHVAEPWYGDPEADAMIRRGGVPRLERLMAFFPGMPAAADITPVAVSTDTDLAIVRIGDSPAALRRPGLPLAEIPAPAGELVTVIGYPMGVAGMVAKSPQPIYERLAYRHDDMGAANELAALSLIRPSATYGHLGDVVGNKLVYDAPTAHGGSGGPVFDSHGQVIGVNSAYMDGFSGGNLGISVGALKPLIEAAQRQRVP
jgi:S1-C subfamily serine protease